MKSNVFKNNLLIAELKRYTLTEWALTAYVISVVAFDFTLIWRICLVLFALIAGLKILQEEVVHLHVFFWLSMGFIFYAGLTVMWAQYLDYSFQTLNVLLKLIIITVLIYNVMYEKKQIEILLRAFLVGGFVLCLRLIIHFGPTVVMSYMLNGKRLGEGVMDYSTGGELLAVIFVLCLYYGLFKKNKYAVLCSILPFLMALASGSRQAIIVSMIGIFCLLGIKYGIKRFYKVAFISTLTIVALYFSLQMPIFISANTRLEGLTAKFTGDGEVDASTEERSRLLAQGVDLIKEKPILGYGLNNFRVIASPNFRTELYSHQNYVELMVSGGIIALILFYVMYLYVFVKLWRRCLIYKDSLAVAICTLLLIRVVMDFVAVTYYEEITWLYLTMGFLTVKRFALEDKYNVNWSD